MQGWVRSEPPVWVLILYPASDPRPGRTRGQGVRPHAADRPNSGRDGYDYQQGRGLLRRHGRAMSSRLSVSHLTLANPTRWRGESQGSALNPRG
jgi:hypothetical protein